MDKLKNQADVVHNTLQARSKVFVVGAGVTGRALAMLFAKAGYGTKVLDQNPLPERLLEEFGNLGIEVNDSLSDIEGDISSDELNDGFAVSSPGISPENHLLRYFRQHSAPVFSELDIGISYLGQPRVGVTGTNGKTTTTRIIEAILNAEGKGVKALGNLGVPLSSSISELGLRDGRHDKLDYVAELSSYQLETSQLISPFVSVCLNLKEDHLGRHGDMAAYAMAKSRIFGNQKKDNWAVLNRDDQNFDKFKREVTCNLFTFGKQGNVDCRIDSNNRELLFSETERISLSNWRLLGEHNLYNAAAAACTARVLGVKTAVIEEVLQKFSPLRHRLQTCFADDGILYINDSKSTNIDSANSALLSMFELNRDGALYVIIGGRGKSGGFASLLPLIGDLNARVLAFGESREQVCADLVSRNSFKDLVSVHKYLKPKLRSGDTVLLSPACASFDLYANFEERGEHFLKLFL